MIERTKVNGKDATVCYLSVNFDPVDPSEASIIKVIFDDGEILFLAGAPVDAKEESDDTDEPETGN